MGLWGGTAERDRAPCCPPAQLIIRPPARQVRDAATGAVVQQLVGATAATPAALAGAQRAGSLRPGDPVSGPGPGPGSSGLLGGGGGGGLGAEWGPRLLVDGFVPPPVWPRESRLWNAGLHRSAAGWAAGDAALADSQPSPAQSYRSPPWREPVRDSPLARPPQDALYPMFPDEDAELHVGWDEYGSLVGPWRRGRAGRAGPAAVGRAGGHVCAARLGVLGYEPRRASAARTYGPGLSTVRCARERCNKKLLEGAGGAEDAAFEPCGALPPQAPVGEEPGGPCGGRAGGGEGMEVDDAAGRAGEAAGRGAEADVADEVAEPPSRVQARAVELQLRAAVR